MYASRSIDERIAIVRLFSKYENGSREDLPRSGRPTILSEEKLKEIEEIVIGNLQLSIRQGAVQAGISKTRYQAAMKQLHFKPYRPTLIVDLNIRE